MRQVTSRTVDVHLMIADPDRYIGDFAEAGADVITVHVEAAVHLQRTLAEIRSMGRKAGVALNPATPLAVVEEVLDDIDLLLIMTVNPGFGGQAFIPASLDKVARARRMIEARRPGEVDIEVDGGVSATTAPALVQAGATVLVAGSAVFGDPGGPGAGVDAIRAAIRDVTWRPERR